MLYLKQKYKVVSILFFFIGICCPELNGQKDSIDLFSLWDTTEVREYIERNSTSQNEQYKLWRTIRKRAIGSYNKTIPFYYLKEIETVPETLNDREKVTRYTKYSVYATNKYLLSSALRYAHKAEDIAEKAHDNYLRGKVKHVLGWYYAANSDFERSHKTYDEAIELFRSVNYTDGIRNTMVKKGLAFQVQDKNKEALTLFREVYNMKERTPSKNDISLFLKSSFINGDTTTTKKLLEEYFDIVLKENRDTINNQYYMIKAIESSIQENDSLEFNYLTKARDIALDRNQHKELLTTYNKLGNYYFQREDYKNARDNFGYGMTLVYNNLMHNRFLEPNGFLIKAAEKRKNWYGLLIYKALRINYIKETIQKNKVNTIIENNKESTLLRQKKEIQSQNTKIWLLTALGLIGLGLLFFSSFYFRKYKKIVNDLSEKNELLDISVQEKQTLLQETHHRVKNNLQIIASLLNLQRKYTKDTKLSAALIDGRNRVKSMALIHQLLYQKKNLDGINVRNYVENLMSSLFSSLKADAEQIVFINKVDPLNLHEDTLLSIGLIINELVTNSIKYAFEDKKKGEISIFLTKEGNLIMLSISDNGKGIPDNFDINDKSSFGYSLITSLSKKLDAKIIITNHEGTTVSLEIKKFIET